MFDKSKSPTIQKFFDSGSPVKLKNITFQDDSQHYLAQLKVNTRSVITMADNSEVNFERIHTPSIAKKETIVKISDLQHLQDDDLVTVQGLFTLSSHPPKEQKCRSGQIKAYIGQ